MTKRGKANDSAAAGESSSAVLENASPVEIDGKTYNLCFDYEALAKAETHFNKQGHRFNLLFSLCSQTLEGVQNSFPCLVHKFHPELSWEEAQALVNIVSAYPILVAVAVAFDRQGGNAKPQEASADASTL